MNAILPPNLTPAERAEIEAHLKESRREDLAARRRELILFSALHAASAFVGWIIGITLGCFVIWRFF